MTTNTARAIAAYHLLEKAKELLKPTVKTPKPGYPSKYECPCGFKGHSKNIRPHRSSCPVWQDKWRREPRNDTPANPKNASGGPLAISNVTASHSFNCGMKAG